MATSSSPGMRSEAIREANLSSVLRAVHLDGVSSRTELVGQVGLTRSSVGALVGDLVSFGLCVEERADPDGSPGRPSTVVRPVTDRNVVIAIDILVDSIAVAAVGLGGVVLHAEREDRPRGRTKPDQTIDDLTHLYRRVIAQLDPTGAVYSIGVAVPALIREPGSEVVLAPNLGWVDVPLPALLREKLKVDLPIAVENEAAAAALAESRRGAAVGRSHVLCVWGEVGIGGGIVEHGQIYRGASGFAGEIGHLPLNLDGSKCGCGAVGCLETELGEQSLLRRAGFDPDGGRGELSALFAGAEQGDPTVLDALREHGRWLGIGLGGVINLLNPEVVVLGGFLGEAMPFMETAMRPELHHRSLDAVMQSLDVVPGECGPNAPLLGAAEQAWDFVIARPSASLDQRVAVSKL